MPLPAIVPLLFKLATVAIPVIGTYALGSKKSSDEARVENYKTLGKSSVALVAIAGACRMIHEVTRKDTKDINAALNCDRNGASVQITTTPKEELPRRIS